MSVTVPLAETQFRHNEGDNVRVPKLKRLIDHLIAAEAITIDDAIAAIAALSPVADRYIYFTSPTAAALGIVTAFGRSILDDGDGAAVRTTIGAEAAIAAGATTQYLRGDKSWQALNAAAVAFTPAGGIASANVQAAIAELDAEKEPAIAAGSTAQYRRGDKSWQALNAAAVAFAPAGNVAAATVQGAIAELDGEKEPVIAPGTASHYWRGDKSCQALNAAAVAFAPAGNIAAANVQAAIAELDSEKQPLDAELNALSGLASAANKLPYFTGAGTAALADFSAAGRALVDDADAAAQRATLGLVIGTNVQAQDSELAAIAALASAADRLPYFTGAGAAALATFTSAGRALVDDSDAAAQRATLGLAAVASSGSAADLAGALTIGIEQALSVGAVLN